MFEWTIVTAFAAVVFIVLVGAVIVAYLADVVLKALNCIPRNNVRALREAAKQQRRQSDG